MREQKRKEKQLEKLKLKEMENMNKKIAAEEYLLLMAQRKLESIRLLGELINRIKVMSPTSPLQIIKLYCYKKLCVNKYAICYGLQTSVKFPKVCSDFVNSREVFIFSVVCI